MNIVWPLMFLRYSQVVMQEAHILKSHASTRATTTAPSSVKSSSSCDPAAAPIKADHHHHRDVPFDPAAWFEAKTSRLLNKILAEGSCGQQHEIHKKPARIMAHPIFPSLHKKTYMTRNFDPLNKQQHMTPKSTNVVNNNPHFDQAGVTNSKERNNISRKADDQVSVHEPIFLLDKRDLMTVNSRPASVTSPGLVHVARYKSLKLPEFMLVCGFHAHMWNLRIIYMHVNSNFEGSDSHVFTKHGFPRMSLKSNTAKSLKALILTSFIALATLFQAGLLNLCSDRHFGVRLL